MDDDEIQMIEQPAGLKVRLFNHQLASVWQMERLERERNIRDGNSVQLSTNIGINADITGYRRLHWYCETKWNGTLIDRMSLRC